MGRRLQNASVQILFIVFFLPNLPNKNIQREKALLPPDVTKTAAHTV
jgi:hypothetical protein